MCNFCHNSWCNGECHSWSYNSCNTCHHSPCTCNVDVCGCPEGQINSKCVYYRGTTTCLGITTGTTLESIVKTISTAICAIVAPSGFTYVVLGTAYEIDVASATVGTTTTFTVSLDSNITNHLSNIDSSIATLTTCCDDSVKDITTGTPSNLLITEPSSGTFNIDFISPSGLVTYDGIVYNDTTASAVPTGTGATVISKTFTRNYISSNSIQNGDEIRFIFSGNIKMGASFTDDLIIELFNSNTATIISTHTANGFNMAGISSYYIVGRITVNVSGSSAVYTLDLIGNNTNNGTGSIITNSGITVDEDVSSVDYTALTIRIKQVNNSLLGATDNRVKNLLVEVRKFI